MIIKERKVKISPSVAIDMIKNSITVFADDINKNQIFNSYSFIEFSKENKIEQKNESYVKKLLIDNFANKYINSTNLKSTLKDEMIIYLNDLVNK